MTPKKRKIVWDKFGHRCAYCGNPLPYEKMQVDHVEPLLERNNSFAKELKKDPNSWWNERQRENNLFPSCYRCNHYKRGYTLENFRGMLLTLPGRIESQYIDKVAIDYGIITLKEWDGVFFFEKYQIDPGKYPVLEFVKVAQERESFNEYLKRTFKEAKERK